jgi:hypothetical protein
VAKAPLRISPIRRADAAIPSSIATANLLRPPEPLRSVLPWPPPLGPSSAFLPRLGQKRKHGPWRCPALLSRREARSRPGAAVTPWRPGPCAMPRFSLKIGPLKISRHRLKHCDSGPPAGFSGGCPGHGAGRSLQMGAGELAKIMSDR